MRFKMHLVLSDPFEPYRYIWQTIIEEVKFPHVILMARDYELLNKKNNSNI